MSTFVDPTNLQIEKGFRYIIALSTTRNSLSTRLLLTSRSLVLALLIGLAACNPPPPSAPKVLVHVAIGGSGSGHILSDTGEVISCARICTPTFTEGTKLTVTADATTGSIFAGWGGACTGVAPCAITFDAEKTIIAYFRRNTKIVAAGGYHSCVLRPAGDVVCWGRNQEGQVGNGQFTPNLNVSPVSGISNVVQIATGGYHSCALLVGGTVQCWGNNRVGQLGNRDTINSNAPNAQASVFGIANAIAITTGAYHSCALRADFSVMCWGLNDDGQLGDGTTATSLIATVARVSAVSISAGGFHTCAILTNSQVGCWGRNSDGQLGGGTQAWAAESKSLVKKEDGTPLTAVSVAGAIGVGQLGSAIFGGYHMCAIGTDAELYCWGNNNERQIDHYAFTGTYFSYIEEDHSFAHLVGFARGSYLTVAAGAYHICALRTDGIYCQGHGADGELGDGTFGISKTGPLIGTAGAYDVAAGGFHSCAVLNTTPTGTVACWGNNGDGQVRGFQTSGNFGSPTILPAP